MENQIKMKCCHQPVLLIDFKLTLEASCLTELEKHCIFSIFNNMHLQSTGVSKKAAWQHFMWVLLLQARCSDCDLTDWPPAQFLYICFTHRRSEYLHPAREEPTDSLDVASGSLLYHDAGWGWSVCTWWMMMLEQYTIAQGPMCKARCGQKIQRMRSVFPFTLCLCVRSMCDSLTPWEHLWVGLCLRPGYFKSFTTWDELLTVGLAKIVQGVIPPLQCLC